jgi:uncharacterized Zn finger protein
MSDRIELSCGHCGSKQFSLPTTPRPSDDVTCAGCGAVGKYGDIQQQAIAKAKTEIERVLKDAFKKWR